MGVKESDSYLYKLYPNGGGGGAAPGAKIEESLRVDWIHWLESSD